MFTAEVSTATTRITTKTTMMRPTMAAVLSMDQLLERCRRSIAPAVMSAPMRAARGANVQGGAANCGDDDRCLRRQRVGTVGGRKPAFVGEQGMTRMLLVADFVDRHRM